MKTLNLWIERYREVLAESRRLEQQNENLMRIFDHMTGLLTEDQLGRLEALLDSARLETLVESENNDFLKS